MKLAQLNDLNLPYPDFEFISDQLDKKEAAELAAEMLSRLAKFFRENMPEFKYSFNAINIWYMLARISVVLNPEGSSNYWLHYDWKTQNLSSLPLNIHHAGLIIENARVLLDDRLISKEEFALLQKLSGFCVKALQYCNEED